MELADKLGDVKRADGSLKREFCSNIVFLFAFGYVVFGWHRVSCIQSHLD